MNILSYDIEDWFHILDLGEVNSRDKWEAFESRVEEGIELVLSDLNDRKMNATFFCPWLACTKAPPCNKDD